jgi:hypothetical protein
MTAISLPVQPSSDITMNSGTTPSWVGIAMVAITKTRRARRPRNRSFANAKPARVAKNTTVIDVMTATITEFITAFQKSTSESMTRLTFSRKLPPGMSDGIGFWAIVAESDDASRNV